MDAVKEVKLRAAIESFYDDSASISLQLEAGLFLLGEYSARRVKKAETFSDERRSKGHLAAIVHYAEVLVDFENQQGSDQAETWINRVPHVIVKKAVTRFYHEIRKTKEPRWLAELGKKFLYGIERRFHEDNLLD